MPARKKTATATKAPLPETPHEAAIAAPPAPPKTIAPGSKVEFDAAVHIVINGNVYERESFSQEQVQAISAINYADQHIASQEQDLRIYKFGRDKMVAQLIEDISTVEPVGTVEPPEA